MRAAAAWEGGGVGDPVGRAPGPVGGGRQMGRLYDRAVEGWDRLFRRL